DDAYNLDLSKKRAKAVGDYLQTYTEDPNQIFTVGLGEKKPVASNSTAEGKAKNRRVMFATIPGRG
ncbi:MAG: OmpA family protein, partial [Gemmatimonadetes bacterium]|nr:OmpA family protein [Gemmatimonadota bacterium]